MASIYDKASLVLIPSGTKTSKVYSQKPTNGDGDFTFSRSTAATRVNASGNIEKETQNLLLQSNTFDTTWTLGGAASVTGGQAGYDGTNNAWTLAKTAAWSNVSQSIVNSGVKTFSVYAKANASDWGLLVLSTGATDPVAYFDLANGVVGVNASNIDAVITPVSNGWYKISITASQTINAVRIYPAEANTASGATGNIYIQDAQLEQGLVARDYIETTTTAIYGGITDNVPRLDYTDSSCPALLLEPQRTNIVPQSEYLGGWSAINCSLTANSITSPEGVTNSFKITENSAASTQHRVAISVSSTSAIHTMSAYVKNSSGSRMAYIDMGPVTGHFNFATETMYSAQGTANWEDAGNGWYRISITSNTAVTPVTAFAGLSVNNSETYSGDGSSAIEFYGIQLEQGSYATSYIPTYGSAVTRSFDECLDAGDNAVIESTQGTIYGEQKSLETDFTYNYFVAVSDGTNNNRLEIRQSATNLQFLWRVGGTYQGNILLSSAPFSSTIKYALRYSSLDIKFYVNGSLVGTINSPTLYSSGTLNNLQFADGSGGTNFRGLVDKCMYFPTALTDQEMIDLTTL